MAQSAGKTKQWKVVLIAFVVATTFWFFNSLNKDYTTHLSYPVEFVFNRDSLVAVRPLPEKIMLDISGGGWSLLRKMKLFQPVPVEIELGAGNRTLRWMELLPEIREQVQGVVVNRVLVDTLKVNIEPLVTRRMKLKVDTSRLSLATDFRVVSAISLSHPEVAITAPRSFFDTLKSTFTMALVQADINKSFDRQVTIILPKPHLMKVNPEKITVKFDVEQFHRMRIEVPVNRVNFPRAGNVVLADTMAVVHFTVRESLRRKFTAADFALEADFRERNKSDSTVVVDILTAPLDVENVTLEAKKIKLRYVRR
jgi:hypothetical protein